MIEVVIRKNVLDPSEDEVFGTEDLKVFLYNYFKHWPKTAKLYHNEISVESEIPLKDKRDIAKLDDYTGTIYVVVYPAGLAVLGIALIAATVAINLLKSSKKKKSNQVANDDQTQSTNNSFSERSNRERLNSRIPEIYGTVLSTPDLVAKPYIKYKDGQKIEYSYLCVGRGSLEISNLQDNDTLLSSINGAFAEVYGPYTSPNFGSPILTIGGSISEPLSDVFYNKNVDNVSLVGDMVVYGPYRMDKGSSTKMVLNFTSTAVLGVSEVEVGIKTYELTSAGARTGNSITEPDNPRILVNQTIEGVEARLSHELFIPYEYCEVEVWRKFTTMGEEVDLTFESFYYSLPITQNDFGNVTTIYTATVSTEATNSLSNRKLSCTAIRKVKTVTSSGTVGPIQGSKRFIDILLDMALDPKIGNRTVEELDLANWWNVFQEVSSYFGTGIATEFSHTFDNYDTSFEEMFSVVCESCFCSAYRNGSLIKLFLEKEINTSVMLFNHRNILPDSQLRTYRFGNQNDHDGVEVEYVDFNDKAAPKRISLPSDNSANSPDRLQVSGVQNKLQAYFHAHRLWNKIRYQHCAVEFESTPETALIKLNDRIQVADTTFAGTQDGEVIDENGLILTLSENVEFEDGASYVMFLQTVNGTLDSISITAGADSNQVILAQAPSQPLSVGYDKYAAATYQIVKVEDTNKSVFLVDEKDPKDNFVNTIKAINYDSRYYQNDSDYINNVVDENGE